MSPNIRLRIWYGSTLSTKSCHRRCTDAAFPSFVLLDGVMKAAPAAVMVLAFEPTTPPDTELVLSPPLTVVFVLVWGKGDGWAGRSSIGGRGDIRLALRRQPSQSQFLPFPDRALHGGKIINGDSP
jgi:hypothetical protein